MGSLSIFSIVIMAVIIYLIYAAFRGVFGGRGATSATGHYICPACGSRGEPKRKTRGSTLIELVLWLCLIVPGVIYSIWRLTSRYDACPACDAPGMIPVNTPRGQKLIRDADPQ